MNYITADNTLLAQLRSIAEPVEIRDEDGRVVGHYTPVSPPDVDALYERAKQSFDPAEMGRRLKEEHGQGISLEEFWKGLEAREKK